MQRFLLSPTLVSSPFHRLIGASRFAIIAVERCVCHVGPDDRLGARARALVVIPVLSAADEPVTCERGNNATDFGPFEGRPRENPNDPSEEVLTLGYRTPIADPRALHPLRPAYLGSDFARPARLRCSSRTAVAVAVYRLPGDRAPRTMAGRSAAGPRRSRSLLYFPAAAGWL